MFSRARTFRRIAAALMLSTSLTVAAIAISPCAEAQSSDPVSVFLTSNYTYCDATLISKYWKIGIDEAKAAIGRKIQSSMQATLDGSLAEARGAGNACTWADVPHSYEDAERIAAAWGLADAGEAKDKIAYLYTQGRSAEVVQALASAPDTGQPDPEEQAAWAAFAQSDYTYCDAQLIAVAWTINVDQAKAEIGRKILGGYAENLTGILADARKQASCEFSDTQLSYDDAERLASIWGVDVPRAKDKAAAYYTAGQSAVVLGALGMSGPRGGSPRTEEPSNTSR